MRVLNPFDYCLVSKKIKIRRKQYNLNSNRDNYFGSKNIIIVSDQNHVYIDETVLIKGKIIKISLL